MANDFTSSSLGPITLWADLGMRALDMTLSSTQNIGEGVDRLTRAAAAAEANGDASFASVAANEAVPGGQPVLALAARVQRASFDMMLNGWLQWMSTLGTVASLAVGRDFVAHQRPVLDALRKRLQQPWPAGAAARAQPAPSSPGNGGAGERRAASAPVEHAAASTGPRGRRGGGRAKRKARNSAA